jgi:hypothetical protein
MRLNRRVATVTALAAIAACSTSNTVPDATASGKPGLAVKETTDSPAIAFDLRGESSSRRSMDASGEYRFFVPADFNGGIFGGSVDNNIVFDAHRGPDGKISGHFHYVQNFSGTINVYSGRVTCFEVYDTPVLVRFPDIPAKTQNRAKWGGLVEHSTDPTEPPGSYIWFQSIDNNSPPHHGNRGEPDLSTESGFGDEAANAAFCAIDKVPNPNFGPFAIQRGNIVVK